jgi:hypothetical protein
MLVEIVEHEPKHSREMSNAELNDMQFHRADEWDG